MPTVVALLSALLTFAVAGIWTTFITVPKVMVVVGVLVVGIAVEFYRKRRAAPPVDWRHWLLRPLFASACFTGAICLAAKYATYSYPWKPFETTMRASTTDFPIWGARPRYISERGTVFFIPELNRPIHDARRWIRPLAEAGYSVVALRVESFTISQLNASVDLLSRLRTRGDFPGPYLLMGHGEGGRFIQLVATSWDERQPIGVVVLSAHSWWPVEELSPLSNLARFRTDLLILHGEADRIVDQSEAMDLHRYALHRHLDSTLVIYEGDDHDLTSNSQNAVEEILRFFETNREPVT